MYVMNFIITIALGMLVKSNDAASSADNTGHSRCIKTRPG